MAVLFARSLASLYLMSVPPIPPPPPTLCSQPSRYLSFPVCTRCQRRVHRVASATAQSDVAAAKSPLLGRLTEVMTMTGALSDLLAGKTRLVIYEGPAGSGKSRLVDEARVQAATRNVAVYSAQGVAVEATTALYAVRSVFASIFRKASSPRRVRKRVKRLLGSALPSVPLLETVLPHISFEETFDEANLERGQTRSQALYVLLKDLFKAANKVPSRCLWCAGVD